MNTLRPSTRMNSSRDTVLEKEISKVSTSYAQNWKPSWGQQSFRSTAGTFLLPRLLGERPTRVLALCGLIVSTWRAGLNGT